MASHLLKKIAFRFDVSKKIGYGHFMRCLSLAEKLNKKYSFQIYFIVNKDFSSKSLIKNKKIKIIYLNKTKNYLNEEIKILKLINKLKINCIFFDIKKDYSINFLKKLSINKIKIITIDDKYNKKNYSDICFYPPVPQVDRMNWVNFKGKKFIGWQYIPLRSQFEKITKHKTVQKKILIMGGGSNNKNFTYKILKKMNTFKNRLELVILLGFKINLNNEYKKIIEESHHKVLVIKNKYHIKKMINESLLAILPFGVTAYEVAALQKYSILFTNSKDDEMSASIFQKTKIGYCIKNNSIFNEKVFNKVINEHQKYLFRNKFKYSKYIRSGTEKIAKIIYESFKYK